MSTTPSATLTCVPEPAFHRGASADLNDPMPTTEDARGHRAQGPRSGGAPRQRQPAPTLWLTYVQAAEYTGWAVSYLRNLVSAGQIPVYGKPRVRRFRQDMLDSFLTDPDAAMRRFRAERNPHGG